jgi:alginate O-acetyltransferase complex protein AlgI
VSAYRIDAAGAWTAAALIGAVLALALLVARTRPTRQALWSAWLLAPLGVAAADRLTAHEPPGFRMLVLIAVLLLAMKAVVSVRAARDGGARLPASRWIAFATLWPGMRTAPFARPAARAEVATVAGRGVAARGVAWLVTGGALLVVARLVWHCTGRADLATIALLPALSLILHFGLFGLATGMWRAAGVEVEPPFRAPWRAASLHEFWGRRWNVPFSELTAAAVFRPLATGAGARIALLLSFLFSGLLHEVAISLPVRAGYGGPMAYFALHGLLMTLERRRGAFGRLGTWAAVVIPVPLLFHRPFLEGVLWPLLG